MCRTLLSGGGTPSRAAAFYGATPAGVAPPFIPAASMAAAPCAVGAVDVVGEDVGAGAAEDPDLASSHLASSDLASSDLAGSDLAGSGVTRWRRTRHALVCEVGGTLVQARARGYACMSVSTISRNMYHTLS